MPTARHAPYIESADVCIPDTGFCLVLTRSVCGARKFHKASLFPVTKSAHIALRSATFSTSLQSWLQSLQKGRRILQKTKNSSSASHKSFCDNCGLPVWDKWDLFVALIFVPVIVVYMPRRYSLSKFVLFLPHIFNSSFNPLSFLPQV